MQLADELPMIYTVCIMSYAAFSYGRSSTAKALVAIALSGVACFITVGSLICAGTTFPELGTHCLPQVYYLYAKDPVFHQVAYGIITLATTIRGFYVTEWTLRSALTERVPSEVHQRMRQIRILALAGWWHTLL